MRLECEKLEECEATPELIRELVRNGDRRGEFMIMMRDDDEESYVQVACDFDEVGGTDDGCFDLEYREGAKSPLFHCVKRVPAAEVEGIFLDECGSRGLSVEAVWSADGLLHQVLHLLGPAQGFRRQHPLVRTRSAALVGFRVQT